MELAEEATEIEVANDAEIPLLTSVVQGSIDFKGCPSIRSKSGSWRSASFILGVIMAERLALFGIRSNLISYLSGPMGQSTATAVVNVNVWTGTGELFPLLGAFVGDKLLGRYWAILTSSLFYVLGFGLLSLSVWLRDSSSCKNIADHRTCSPSVFNTVLLFSSLYLVVLMQGVHRPSLQAFGADQFDDQDEHELRSKASFFNWWNISFAAGRLMAYTILNYVQDNLGWELGFGIPCIAMLLATIVFSLGTGSYRFPLHDNERNPFRRSRSISVKSTSNWKAIFSKEADQIMHGTESTQFKIVDLAELLHDSPDYGKPCSSTNDVKDTKSILKLVPLWFTCLGFAIVDAQANTLFTKQGSTMERHIGSSFEIPAASLQSLLTIATILLLPVYDLIFIPIVRATSKNPRGITVLQRVGIGLFLSIIIMIIAGFVERKRLATATEYDLLDRPDITIPMSIWWLAPQYLVQGISHCFALVGLQEFFYDQIPSELKSFGVALYLSIFGAGNFLSSFLVAFIDKATRLDGNESWFSDNLNRAHLDYFYWLLVGLSSVSFVSYVYLAKSYVYSRKTDI